MASVQVDVAGMDALAARCLALAAEVCEVLTMNEIESKLDKAGLRWVPALKAWVVP